MNKNQKKSDSKQAQLSKKLSQIGIALSSEKNILKLLEMILSESRTFTNCDAGTFYRISKSKKKLQFTVMHNDTMNEYSGGDSGIKPSLKPLDLYDKNKEPNMNAVASYVYHKKESLNIPDIYKDNTPLSEGSKAYEKFSGYRTNSMLVVPMINHEDEVIGILQLLNAKDEDDNIIPFDLEFNDLIQSLGSQAAVALDTVELIDEVENLLESIIRYTVKAIDRRSPHTAGHSSRVAWFTRRLAQIISDKKDGPFKDINYTEEQLKEIWISGIMHDVGKIGVPEAVLEKRNRLDGANFQLVLERFNTIKENFIFNSKIRNLKNNKSEDFVDDELKTNLDEWNEEFEFINWLNKPGFLPDDKEEYLRDLAKKTYIDSSGNEHPYITEEELVSLSIKKGSLNDDERSKIQKHIIHTKTLLNKLPFPNKLKNVPFYASCHHEHVNGKGYPNGLKGDEIPLPARIMCVADVWDAVTAQDRPYKPPTPIDKACEILKNGAKFGEFDKDVVDLFINEKVWEKK